MKFLFIAGLLLSSITVFAGEDLCMNVHKSDTSFFVTLDANATTGFQWSVLSYDKQLLQLSSSIYQAPNTKLIGAGGQMVFRFSVNKVKSYPAQTNMVFKYARSWEPQTATLKKVTVHFVD